MKRVTIHRFMVLVQLLCSVIVGALAYLFLSPVIGNWSYLFSAIGAVLVVALFEFFDKLSDST